jgi:hypothetical protein
MEERTTSAERDAGGHAILKQRTSNASNNNHSYTRLQILKTHNNKVHRTSTTHNDKGVG